MVRRRKSISVLRVMATAAVVFSHACSTITQNPEVATLSPAQFMFLDILQNLCKWHVPVFFMLTGALLLNRPVSPRDCICKYAKRMLLALIVFGIPYALMICYFETGTIVPRMLLDSITMTLSNRSFSHLWYLFTMIGIYAVLPILKLIVDKASKGMLRYLLAVLFVFCFCVPFINEWTGLALAFNTPFGSYVIFYVLLGYYMSDPQNRSGKSVVPASIACLCAATVLTVLVSVLRGSSDAMMSYTSPVNVFATISVYCLGMRNDDRECGEKLWNLDRLCFGVYLIHPLFIQFAYKFLKITPVGYDSWVLLMFVFGAMFIALGFFASWVMSLIKPMKKYLL